MDNESGESMVGMMTSKIKEAAREVCRDEIKNCRQGIENKMNIENIEKEVDNVKLNISAGFQELKGTIEKQEAKREWTLGQIISVISVVVMAIGVIYDIFLKR